MTMAGAFEIELFGVPRLLAGVASVRAEGATLAALATRLGAACPALVGPVIDAGTGWLLPGYTFVVDERFTTDPAFVPQAGASVLLVASAAGG